MSKSKTARQAINAVFGKQSKKEWDAMRPVDMLTFGRMAAGELGCDLSDESKWEKLADADVEVDSNIKAALESAA